MEQTNATPWSLFQESCITYRNNPMVIANRATVTYGDMYDKVMDFTGCFERWKFKFGGIYLPNSAEYIGSLLALNKLRKITVPLSSQLKGESLVEAVNYTGLELLITDTRGFEEIQQLKERLHLEVILVLKPDGTFENHQWSPAEREPESLPADSFGMILIARETTKLLGVVYSNQALIDNALTIADLMEFTSSDRILNTRSFTLEDPIVSDILAPMSRGATIVVLNDLFHPAILLKAIQDYQITSTVLVGTMITLILEYPRLGSFDLNSLLRLTFARINASPSIIEDLIAKLPEVSLYCVYGPREIPSRVTHTTPGETRRFPGSIGRPMPGYEIKVCREDGSPAEIGEEGILHITGKNVMNGFYKFPQLTAEVLTTGGLRTRDIGYQATNGLFYLTGRTDALIIQGGYEIFPVEIQEVLLKHEYVADALVYGADDDKMGKKAVALVQVVKGTIGLPEVYKWYRQNLEDKKIPKETYLVDKIIAPNVMRN